jgi:hypothetical protein
MIRLNKQIKTLKIVKINLKIKINKIKKVQKINKNATDTKELDNRQAGYG